MSIQAQVSPLIIISFGPFHFSTNPALSGSVFTGTSHFWDCQGTFETLSASLVSWLFFFTNLCIPFSWVLGSKTYLLILSFSGLTSVPPVMMLSGNCIVRPVIRSSGVNPDVRFVVVLNLISMVGNTFVHIFPDVCKALASAKTSFKVLSKLMWPHSEFN